MTTIVINDIHQTDRISQSDLARVAGGEKKQSKEEKAAIRSMAKFQVLGTFSAINGVAADTADEQDGDDTVGATIITKDGLSWTI